eukprot:CAMPEP_0175871238 /NCGR_PEP_ID=MMETSP0107_2-20121207/37019_1 /TAXON_ID=195067 ORGANISM="Goniomonas pacifica, Strain CCMP1869" /NCGR_SAMPLE_ID=MMETSP0107_2 /ASSEMBLY_ACC=CAM_ASM_000203 /LENGTH=90 /DNA_ID=CAMNT_0017189585 /DNA_START=42 /DNA_END=314 /DNA_ORIENTATION=-
MSFYDEIEIEDMNFDSESKIYTYPCPCGDMFQITLVRPPLDDLYDGEEVATCPSCSLIIRVIYSPEDFERPKAEPEAPKTSTPVPVEAAA